MAFSCCTLDRHAQFDHHHAAAQPRPGTGRAAAGTQNAEPQCAHQRHRVLTTFGSRDAHDIGPARAVPQRALNSLLGLEHLSSPCVRTDAVSPPATAACASVASPTKDRQQPSPAASQSPAPSRAQGGTGALACISRNKVGACPASAAWANATSIKLAQPSNACRAGRDPGALLHLPRRSRAGPTTFRVAQPLEPRGVRGQQLPASCLRLRAQAAGRRLLLGAKRSPSQLRLLHESRALVEGASRAPKRLAHAIGWRALARRGRASTSRCRVHRAIDKCACRRRH